MKGTPAGFPHPSGGPPSGYTSPRKGDRKTPGMRFASCMPKPLHSSKHRQRSTKSTEHQVFQEEGKTAVTASLHAFGINIQARECAKNAQKRPAKARCMVSQWVGGLLVL